jgi:hypothetical protein
MNTDQDFATYYLERTTSASKEQGTEAISEALTKAGIKNTVEQTGGFCMVVFVYSEDKKKAIKMNATGLSFSPDLSKYDNEEELTPKDFIGDEEEGCRPEVCDQLVELVKKNLYLLN